MRRTVTCLSGQAVRFNQCGVPKNVLRLEDAPAAEKPAQDQVVVRMEAAAIHPMDLAVVRGVAGGSSSSVGGTDGVGVVEQVGSASSQFQVNDRVLVSGLGVGTWTSRGAFDERHVYALQASTPIESAAALSSTMAALAMVEEHGAQLAEGQVVVHVGSPGAVGMALTQVLAAKKVHVVHILQDGPGVDEAVALLKEHGAMAAVTLSYARSSAFRRLLSDVPAPTLVLNGLGGRAATEGLRTLASGTMVTYGGEPFAVPASALIDRPIQLCGFSLERKLAAAGKKETQALVTRAEQANVKTLAETHSISKFSEALAQHEEPSRLRKIILKM